MMDREGKNDRKDSHVRDVAFLLTAKKRRSLSLFSSLLFFSSFLFSIQEINAKVTEVEIPSDRFSR